MRRPSSSQTVDLAHIRSLLEQCPPGLPLVASNDESLRQYLVDLENAREERWKQIAPEVVTPRRDGMPGMVIARKRRQLAYSIKLSNIGRDPFATLPAIAVGTAGATAIPAMLASPPVSFPSFLVGIALVLFRAFAQPIGFGEAALLHLMVQISAIKGMVSEEDLADAGAILVEQYGYVKGKNSSEVAALLASLVAWKAIEPFGTGYRVVESVPFGFGRIEYVS